MTIIQQYINTTNIQVQLQQLLQKSRQINEHHKYYTFATKTNATKNYNKHLHQSQKYAKHKYSKHRRTTNTQIQRKHTIQQTSNTHTTRATDLMDKNPCQIWDRPYLSLDLTALSVDDSTLSYSQLSCATSVRVFNNIHIRKHNTETVDSVNVTMK